MRWFHVCLISSAAILGASGCARSGEQTSEAAAAATRSKVSVTLPNDPDAGLVQAKLWAALDRLSRDNTQSFPKVLSRSEGVWGEVTLTLDDGYEYVSCTADSGEGGGHETHYACHFELTRTEIDSTWVWGNSVADALYAALPEKTVTDALGNSVSCAQGEDLVTCSFTFAER